MLAPIDTLSSIVTFAPIFADGSILQFLPITAVGCMPDVMVGIVFSNNEATCEKEKYGFLTINALPLYDLESLGVKITAAALVEVRK